jgi:hypothetical protein
MVRKLMLLGMIIFIILPGVVILARSGTQDTNSIDDAERVVCGTAAPGHAHCDARGFRRTSPPTANKIYGIHKSGYYKSKHAYPPGVLPPYGSINLETAYNLPKTSSQPESTITPPV